MADSKEPKRPITPYTPGSPLPRLWKSEPDEEPEDVTKAAKKAKNAASESSPPAAPRKSKKSGADKKGKDSKKPKDKDGASKGVLIEETPNLDTYETRQRVRIAIGVVLFVLVLVVGFAALRIFSPTHTQEEPIPQDLLTVTGTTGNPRERAEQEARILFERAEEVAKHGRTELALAILKKVSTAYPATPAAAEAKEALDRPRQNLPLFLDRPAVVASQVDRPPPPPSTSPPERVVDATRTTVASTVGAQAKLVQPVNPPEPSAALPATPAPAPAPADATPPAPENASRPLPKGFHPRPGAVIHPSGWPTAIVGDRDGSPLVLVAGGTFIQGRDDAESAEGPAHQVVLGTYYIDQHEVTVRQFNLFQKESGKRGERVRALAKDQATASAEADEERPVVMVTAREASDYSAWAGKRLPTEAQWEAAARTPDGRIFPWGPEPPTWSKPRAFRQIDPVMSYPSDVSPYGAFDLAGNAWEWTKDWYDPKYYQQFRATTADNPTGPVNRTRSQQLVVKGSSKDWRVSKRDGIKFDQRLPFLGFRCVLQVEGPGNAFEPPPAAIPAGGGAPAVGGGSGVPF